MSAKPEASADAAAAPPKSKKLLLIIVGVVVLLVILAGVAFFIIAKQHSAAAEGEEEAAPEPKAEAVHVDPKAAPTYMPLDPMVVNLADPGGERVAQVGITLELLDAKSADTVKAYLPTIKSSILLLISQRTADELLKPEGKEKLQADIVKEASVPFGGTAHDEEVEEAPSTKKKKKKAPEPQYPVTGVLFSSFIVQ